MSDKTPDPQTDKDWAEFLDTTNASTVLLDAEEALQELEDWRNAYPETIFTKPDYKKAAEVLAANGMTLDGISADILRDASSRAYKIAAPFIRAALRSAPPLEAPGEVEGELGQAERAADAPYLLADSHRYHLWLRDAIKEVRRLRASRQGAGEPEKSLPEIQRKFGVSYSKAAEIRDYFRTTTAGVPPAPSDTKGGEA